MPAPLGGSTTGTLVTISVGSQSWYSAPDKPGYFSVGPPGTVSDVLQPLTFASQATDVHQEGGLYGFTSTQSSASGGSFTVQESARIEDGKIMWVTMRLEIPDANLTYIITLSRFGSAPEVNPPPANRVEAASPIPTCGPSIGSYSGSPYICTGGPSFSP